MEQLLAHLVGDYLLQNDWMALNKKKPGWYGEVACVLHCVLYSLPFLLINVNAVGPIMVSHYILDRFHIVDYFLALRNGIRYTSNFGFGKERPFAIVVWLNIITDNTFHLLINYFIIKLVSN